MNLGTLIGCVENGFNPNDWNQLVGFVEQMNKSANCGEGVGRVILGAAQRLLQTTGREHAAETQHLGLLLKRAGWDAHSDEVARHVILTLNVLRPMEKQAFGLSDVASGAGLAGRTALYGSLGAGAGLGALYWLLSRHANQDEADSEAMQNQVNYYNELSKELSDSMRRKYRYDRNQQPTESDPESERDA